MYGYDLEQIIETAGFMSRPVNHEGWLGGDLLALSCGRKT